MPASNIIRAHNNSYQTPHIWTKYRQTVGDALASHLTDLAVYEILIPIHCNEQFQFVYK